MQACGALGKYSDAEIRIILKDMYDQKYGIFDHANKTKERPLASVALHPSEEFINNSAIRDHIRLFAKKKIYETWGISHIELMNMPREIANHYYAIADEEMTIKSEVADNVETDIQREMKKRSKEATSSAKKPI